MNGHLDSNVALQHNITAGERGPMRDTNGAVGIRLVVLSLLIISNVVFLPASPRSEAYYQVEATFHDLLARDQGDIAVQRLADIARERGGWASAPGDVAVFDASMLRLKRASTVAIDVPPTDCAVSTKGEPQNLDCGRDFQHQQHQLRFGRLTFMSPLSNGTFQPRRLDDMLSVYIEEVGHSWQEYCYETEGRCAGERTRPTTWRAGKRLVTGWEYQVKRYILSLDGQQLILSESERTELMSAICEGYANPRYRPVPEYSAPPGWPHPEGWPTHAPSADELQAFCAAERVQQAEIND